MHTCAHSPDRDTLLAAVCYRNGWGSHTCTRGGVTTQGDDTEAVCPLTDLLTYHTGSAATRDEARCEVVFHSRPSDPLNVLAAFAQHNSVEQLCENPEALYSEVRVVQWCCIRQHNRAYYDLQSKPSTA